MSHPNLSSIFYNYLRDLIGTEDLVNSRRRIYTANDHVQSNKVITYISSGSKAEGLDLEGSDFDVMFVFNCCPVYEGKDDSVPQMTGLFPFVMDTTDCKPGFTKLKRYNNSGPMDKCCENKAGETYLSSSMLKSHYRKGIIPSLIHGPCISNSDGTLDFAICLRCNKWITQANPWKVRSRHSWASDNVINAILKFGILFVPIGCKNSSNIDFEWRISFSYAEKLLIWSFNHVQLLCYALLKILLKDSIKETTGDLSYFLKTVMLWICEETKPSQWKANNILSCFMSCLNRLIYCVKHKTCVHYFIQENDLFAERFDKQQHSLLMFTLDQLQSLGWTCLLHTKTLSLFRGFYVQDQSILIHKASYLDILYNLQEMQEGQGSQSLAHIINICLRSNNKDFLIERLSEINKCIGDEFLDYVCNSNKQIYKIYRKRLCHILIGLNQDAVFGWLMVASFLYVNKQYQICTEILSDCLSRCTRDKILLTENLSKEEHTRFNILQKKLGLRHLDFIRKFTIKDVMFTSSSQIVPEEIEVLDYIYGKFLPVPPVAFGLFLAFLCYNYLSDDQKKYESLRALENVIQNRYFIYDNYGLNIAHRLLSIAYSV